MRVTGIRHGQAKSNTDIENGTVGSDHPLDREGIAQVRERAIKLKHRRLGGRALAIPHVLWHSPYRRTKHTAEVIAEECPEIEELRPDVRLQEIQKGAWHGQPVPEIMQLEAGIPEKERPFFRPPSSDTVKGENWEDVALRGTEFIEEKAEELELLGESEVGEIMFVSHNHTILCVTGKLLGISVAKYEERPLKNGGLVTIRRTLNGWIEEDHQIS